MNRIFHIKEPENMFYEMFLDEDGTKISKSVGRGLTVEEWLKYGTIESLNLLMYRRPRKAKELSFKIIPTYVDDLISMSRDYHNGSHREEHEFNFITNYHAKEKVFPHISYMLICNLMAALKSDDKDMIKNYISKQKDLSEKDMSGSFFNELIDKAGRYYHDFVSTRKQEITFSDEEISCLEQFIEFLKTESPAEEIQTAIYEIARKNNIKPQDFFKTIYHALIGQDRGPRLSNFIKMIGQEKTIEIMGDSITSVSEKPKEASGGMSDK